MFPTRVASFNLIVITKFHQIIVSKLIDKKTSRVAPFIIVVDECLKYANRGYFPFNFVPTIVFMTGNSFYLSSFIISLDTFHEFIVDLKAEVCFFN